MRIVYGLVSFAAIAAALAFPAAAQPPISAGGEITDADPADATRRHYDDHPLRLDAGRRYSFTVTSDAFDPVARLYRAGEDEPVAENDDSGGSLNSRIVYAPPAAGDYRLRVVAFSEAGRGAYQLRVEGLAPLPPAVAVPWSVSGRLEDGDSAEGGEDARTDDYVVRLEAGRRYRLFVESDAFDPVATLLAPGRGEQVARNDDSGGSLNARISYSPRETGDYVLAVSSFSAGGRGAYRAGAEPAPPLPAPISTPGETVATNGSWALWRGALDASDPDDGERHFDDYLIRVEPGRRRYISLEGTGFDALIQVLRPEGRESDSPDVVDQDDDAGAGLNAFLVFAPEAGGDYIVRVTSVGDGTGSYRLWISE